MPLIDIHVIRNVFTSAQKGELVQRVTDAVVAVEGEPMRGVTWVRLHEIDEGNWAIGGMRLAAADVHRMARQHARLNDETLVISSVSRRAKRCNRSQLHADHDGGCRSDLTVSAVEGPGQPAAPQTRSGSNRLESP